MTGLVRTVLVLGLIVALAAVAGCDSWGDATPSADQEECGCQGSVTLPFNPRPLINLIPWPNDLLTTPDPLSRTGLRLNFMGKNPPLVEEILEKTPFMRIPASALDGFAPTGDIVFAVEGDLNHETLPGLGQSGTPVSPIQVIADSPGTPEHGERHPFFSEWLHEEKHVRLMPMVPLAPKTHYVVAIVGGLTDWEGGPVCPSEDFQYMKSREMDPDRAFFRELEPARLHYQEIFAFLESEAIGIPREQVILAFDFTTCSVADDLVYIQDYLSFRAEFLPPVPKTLEIEEAPGGQPSVAFRIKGTFDSPNFQGIDGSFHRNPDTDLPEPLLPDAELEFVMTMPTEGEYEQPFPVAVYLHGANNRKEGMYAMTDHMAEQGFATAGIDFVLHGSRARGEIIYSSLDFFFPANPLKMRDNIRQSIADVLQFVLFLRNLESLDVYPWNPDTGEAGDGIADLDVEHIISSGHSMGAMFSPLLLAVSPHVEAGVLVAGGGGYTDVALNTSLVQELISVINIVGEFEINLTVKMIVEIAKLYLDCADPCNYIGLVTEDPHPFVGETKDLLLMDGIGDPIMPNVSTDKLAFHGSLPLVEPYVYRAAGLEVVPTPVERFALRQFDAADHEFYFGGDPIVKEQARTMVAVFLRTKVETGTGLIVDPEDPSELP